MFTISNEVVTVSVDSVVEDTQIRISVTPIPAFNDSLVTDVLVHIVAGSAIQGEMRFSLINAKLACARGVFWELLQETSLAAQVDEVSLVVEPGAPRALLVLDHFARTAGCTLPPHSLSRAAAKLFEDDKALEKLGWDGAVLLTYPFPLDTFDEEAAARIAALYEDEWGMEPVLQGGVLRKLSFPRSKNHVAALAFFSTEYREIAEFGCLAE